jgi:uncharacterized membrane protein
MRFCTKHTVAILGCVVVLSYSESRIQAAITVPLTPSYGLTGTLTDLGGSAGSNSSSTDFGNVIGGVTALVPQGINNSGVVTGSYIAPGYTNPNNGFSGTVYSGFSGPATGAAGALKSMQDYQGDRPLDAAYNPGAQTFAFGINNNNLAVGSANNNGAGGDLFHAFTGSGTATSTSVPSANHFSSSSTKGSTAGFAINDLGDVAGQAWDLNAPVNGVHAIVYTPAGGVTDLDTANITQTSAAYAINPAGTQAVGFISLTSGGSAGQSKKIANVWTSSDGSWSGTIGSTSLGTLYPAGGINSQSIAMGVDKAGDIVGVSSTDPASATNGQPEAFVYQGGTMYQLTNPTPGNGGATALNGPDSTTLNLYASQFGVFNSLTHPFLSDSLAEAINDNAQAVGYYHNAAGTEAAALWELTGNGTSTLLDLNTFAPSGWTFTEATGINDVGQIVGIGAYQTPAQVASGALGSPEAFALTIPGLVTSVPEPTGLLAIAAVVGLLGRRRARSN